MGYISRRSFIRQAIAGVIAGLYTGRLYALSTTPPEIKGPFYPALPQQDTDFDLTKIDGQTGSAHGKIIYLQGRILNSNGQSIENAVIDIWQANAAGRYRHPRDRNPAALDDNFQGWAILRSGQNGAFNFKTIMPGAYPSGGSWLRPPHIHFKVTGEGHCELITQMYFPGNKLNDSDLMLRRKSSKERSRMIATKVKDDPETYEYNVVLRPG